MALQHKSPDNLSSLRKPTRRATAPVNPSRRESMPGFAPQRPIATEPIIEVPGTGATPQLSAEPVNYLVPSRETLLGLSAFIRAVAMQQPPAGFMNIDLERAQGLQPPTPLGAVVPPTPDAAPPLPLPPLSLDPNSTTGPAAGPPIYSPSPYYPLGWVPPPHPSCANSSTTDLSPPTHSSPPPVMPAVVAEPSGSTVPFVSPVTVKTPLDIVKEELDIALSETDRKLGKEAEGTAPETDKKKWEDINPLFVLRAYQPEELSHLREAGLFRPWGAKPKTCTEEENILHAVLYERPLDEEIEAVKQVLSVNGWALPPALRAVLYMELFKPLSTNQCKVWQRFIPNVLVGHVKILHQLETYGVDQLTRYRDGSVEEQNVRPNLLEFVNDVIHLTRLLKSPLLPFQSPSDIPLAHPIYQFAPSPPTPIALGSSPTGFVPENADPLRVAWNEWPYMRGLADTIFGLLPEEGNQLPLSEYGCRIAETLDGVTLSDRAGVAPVLDYRALDASNIEACGPFRFRATDNVANHLNITPDNEILFYIHWPTWARLTNHSVLLDSDNLPPSVPYIGTKFDVITSLSRNPVAPFSFGSMRGHLIGLHSDICIQAYLFFFQDIVNRHGRDRPARIRYWQSFRTALRNKLRPTRSTSLGIARRLGIDTPESELAESGRALLAMVGNDWEALVHPRDSFRLRGAFKDRVDRLHNTLKTWRPRTVWELRYSGYGNVDPVNLYAFYFAGAFGIIALLGLGATIAQTWAGFRQVQLATPLNPLI